MRLSLTIDRKRARTRNQGRRISSLKDKIENRPLHSHKTLITVSFTLSAAACRVSHESLARLHNITSLLDDVLLSSASSKLLLLFLLSLAMLRFSCLLFDKQTGPQMSPKFKFQTFLLTCFFSINSSCLESV